MEIEILHDLPVIFTKDETWYKDFVKHGHKANRGGVILLPKDAILVIGVSVEEYKKDLQNLLMT